MPRRRFRDPDPQVRDRNRWDTAGQPAAGGLSRIGGAPKSRTRLVGSPPLATGRGTVIHHVSLRAKAEQTITSGGGSEGFDVIDGPPVNVRGFETLLDELGTDGIVYDIPIDLTGVGSLRFYGLWQDPSGGPLVATRIRDGVEAPKVYEMGPVVGRAFDGTDLGWNFEYGDRLRITLPNETDADRTFVEGSLSISVEGVATTTSTLPQPTPVRWHFGSYQDGTGSSGARYEVRNFVDHGDGTFSWQFYKAGGWGNTDAIVRQRNSDAVKEGTTAAYRFPGEAWNFHNYDPSTSFDGQSSFKFWVTNSGTGGINATADTYVEFLYDDSPDGELP